MVYYLSLDLYSTVLKSIKILGIIPYRFGFNNPNYWSDSTGLFETRELALTHIDTYGLVGTQVNYNEYSAVWEITSGGYTFSQKGNDLIIQFAVL